MFKGRPRAWSYYGALPSNARDMAHKVTGKGGADEGGQDVKAETFEAERPSRDRSDSIARNVGNNEKNSEEEACEYFVHVNIPSVSYCKKTIHDEANTCKYFDMSS